MNEGQTYSAAIVGLGDIGATTQLRGKDLGHLRGIFGRLSHAAAYHDHPRVELVAGSSRDVTRREAFRRNWGVSDVYSDWRKMFERERPDIVSVATNTGSHSEIVTAIAGSGVKAIFAEKPIATRLVDASAMLERCQQERVLLVINHTRRWDPIFEKTRSLIENRIIGDLLQIDCSWPTGRLCCLGTHYFDLIRWLVGAEAESAIGVLDTVSKPDPGGPEFRDPGGCGIILFRNNVKCFINGSEALVLPPRLKFTGTEGEILLANNGGHAELWTKDESPFTDESVAKRQFPVPVRTQYPMLRAVDEIVRALDGNHAPRSNGLDAYAALEMVIGLHLSDQRGNQPVNFPLRGIDTNFGVKSR